MKMFAKPDLRPFAELARLQDGTVRWTSGFWKQRQEMVRDSSLQSVLDALDDTANATYFGNFRAAASGARGFYGRYWSDGDCYKTVETMLLLLDQQHEASMATRIEQMVADIEAAQEPDGYINTQITLTDLGRWTSIEHHELYNFGHLFTLACLHHQVTGSKRLLDVATRAADYLYATFAPRDPAMAKFDFNPSHIMGLVELFRETGRQSYLDLARIFVDNRGAHPDQSGNNGDQSQMRIPLLEETEAVGHAVTGPYLWAGAADIFMETNEKPLLEAVRRIWDDSTYRRMYITGGIGALHKGTSERSRPRYEQVAESYGRPYQLPNDTAYNETCANISNAMWSWRLLQITGEARYADIIEQVMYNSGLSGISLSGTEFTYTNPLRHNGDKQFIGNNDSPRRWQRFGCYCCPPQVTRTLAGMHRWAYSSSADGLWVHLFGSSHLAFGTGEDEIVLEQTTNFPWEGTVSLSVKVAPKRAYGINIRIPGWANGAVLSVNGSDVPINEAGAHYHGLHRVWQPGDKIELRLDLSPRIVIGRPEIEETRNQCAVLCGPLVYCLEGADLPDGTGIDEVVINPSTEFKSRLGSGMFEGMRLLDATLSSRAPWTDPGLYAPLPVAPTANVRATLIPYFAWNNRADNTMSVWLPLQADRG